MSTTLKINNFTGVNIKEKAQLSSDIDSPATTIPLTNNNNIATNDFILIGRLGAESAEMRKVSSASGATVITTDAVTLHHDQYEPVTILNGNKIRVYRASDVNGLPPVDSAFAPLDTISIDPDQLDTFYTDQAGSSAYWYKYTYFNDQTSTQTDIANSGAVRGGGVGNYTGIDDIRKAAGFANNRNISDSDIDQFRQAAQAKINGTLSGTYVVPFTSPISPIISEIAKIMAAGMLQKDQFGSFTTTSTTNGELKVQWAESQLESIRKGELVIIDATGVPAPGGGSGAGNGSTLGFSGYPTGTTEHEGMEGFMFDRTMIDGYYGREY